jgi:esterase/lipase
LLPVSTITCDISGERLDVHSFFSGNYRWSYNTLFAFAAGGELGDVSMVVDRLAGQDGDDEAWIREWAWLADILERRAAANVDENASISAAENLFLSSLYRTIGEHFIPPDDPRRATVYDQVLDAFERARALSDWPVERLEVPFENSVQPAYFLPSLVGDGPRPAVIFICGLDTTKEISFLRVRQQLAIRGMHCLAIDTPGIGEALKKHGLVTRPDYEVPVAAAIAYLEGRDDVDRNRIGIIGSSLGGYYVARAAAFEPRIRATVAWGAIYDYHRVWMRRINQGGTVAAPSFQLMFITGTETLEAAVEAIKDFKVEPFGHRISTPFMVAHGADDQQVGMDDAQSMFDAIGSEDKTFLVFDGENGGSAHCQFDNHLPAMQCVADRLAGKPVI